MSGGGERTEAPTPRRIRELRKKGTVARSVDLVSAMSLAAVFLVGPWVVPQVWDRSLVMFKDAVKAASSAGDVGAGAAVVGQHLPSVMTAAAPLLIASIAATIAANAAIGRVRPGLVFLTPRWTSIDPKNGIKRVFSTQSLYELGRTTAKVAVLALAAAFAVRDIAALASINAADFGSPLAAVGDAVYVLLRQVLVAALLIGAIDSWWSRRRYNKSAKMTKEEVRQDFRQTEGDPLIKSARRSRALALARARMVTDVADANVVLVNPTHVAVALRYREGDHAPVVVARGAGVLAARIREKAASCGVPVVQNIPLARALYSQCQPGSLIPTELYEAVAVVLATVMRSKKGRRP